ncbi:MAG TPA: methylmalonyl-CoA mutase family protein, partial [candidate division Zixibacteria bacterium]|nr:methylmalonyl-CoA mutase family protein [candidate division Zixibacteria bacterium]
AVLRVDPELERNQVRELAKLKATRDRKAVAESLAAVRDAARQNKNVVEPIIDAVAHYATVGEISDIFREVWGEYHENL